MDNRAQKGSTLEARRELARELTVFFSRAQEQALEVLFDDVVAKHLAAAEARLEERFELDRQEHKSGESPGEIRGTGPQPVDFERLHAGATEVNAAALNAVLGAAKATGGKDLASLGEQVSALSADLSAIVSELEKLFENVQAAEQLLSASGSVRDEANSIEAATSEARASARRLLRRAQTIREEAVKFAGALRAK